MISAYDALGPTIVTRGLGMDGIARGDAAHVAGPPGVRDEQAPAFAGLDAIVRRQLSSCLVYRQTDAGPIAGAKACAGR